MGNNKALRFNFLGNNSLFLIQFSSNKLKDIIRSLACPSFATKRRMKKSTVLEGEREMWEAGEGGRWRIEGEIKVEGEIGHRRGEDGEEEDTGGERGRLIYRGRSGRGRERSGVEWRGR